VFRRLFYTCVKDLRNLNNIYDKKYKRFSQHFSSNNIGEHDKSKNRSKVHATYPLGPYFGIVCDFPNISSQSSKHFDVAGELNGVFFLVHAKCLN
jgi:hypothetical protein